MSIARSSHIVVMFESSREMFQPGVFLLLFNFMHQRNRRAENRKNEKDIFSREKGRERARERKKGTKAQRKKERGTDKERVEENQRT